MSDQPKTCGTCRFWGDERDPPSADLKVCTRIIGEMKLSGEEYKQALAIIDGADGFGNVAVLDTRADFGCVLHEPKEPAP